MRYIRAIASYCGSATESDKMSHLEKCEQCFTTLLTAVCVGYDMILHTLQSVESVVHAFQNHTA